MKRPPVTINDLAAMLGVSKSTISSALKDHPDIGPETKKAVHELARKLHYRPNAVALSFRYKRSCMVGLMVPKISHFFFPSIIEAIEEEVHNQGYNLMTLQSNESHEREVQNLEILMANNVEGIMASVSRDSCDWSHFEQALGLEVPLVFFDRLQQGLLLSSIKSY